LLFRKEWTIAYALTESFPDTFYRFKPPVPPRDRFWADPFPLWQWWSFGGMNRGLSSTTNAELYLFYADSPLGPWHEHQANAVKTDIRSARLAGWLFRHAGQLCRPAQDLSEDRCFATVINRVDVLSESEYRETPVAGLTGNRQPGHSDIHTINFADGLAVADVMIASGANAG